MDNKVIEREDLPLVVINLLTKNRTELAVRTIHQCLRHLKYDGKLLWFVSDNGSPPAHVDRLLECIPTPYYLGHISETGTIGACWNKGIRKIFEYSSYYIRLEDDMCLKADLDITRYIKIMMSYWHVGMVRLGQMCVDLQFNSDKFKIYTHIGFEEEILLRVYRGNPYAFSGHPAIIHKQFHDSYGFYNEKHMSAGELEVSMDNRYRAMLDVPNLEHIYFPWDLGRFGTWGAWDHVGVQKAE